VEKSKSMNGMYSDFPQGIRHIFPWDIEFEPYSDWFTARWIPEQAVPTNTMQILDGTNIAAYIANGYNTVGWDGKPMAGFVYLLDDPSDGWTVFNPDGSELYNWANYDGTQYWLGTTGAGSYLLIPPGCTVEFTGPITSGNFTLQFSGTVTYFGFNPEGTGPFYVPYDGYFYFGELTGYDFSDVTEDYPNLYYYFANPNGTFRVAAVQQLQSNTNSACLSGNFGTYGKSVLFTNLVASPLLVQAADVFFTGWRIKAKGSMADGVPALPTFIAA